MFGDGYPVTFSFRRGRDLRLEAAEAIDQRRHSAQQSHAVADGSRGGVFGVMPEFDDVNVAHQSRRQRRARIGGLRFAEDDEIHCVAAGEITEKRRRSQRPPAV